MNQPLICVTVAISNPIHLDGNLAFKSHRERKSLYSVSTHFCFLSHSLFPNTLSLPLSLSLSHTHTLSLSLSISLSLSLTHTLSLSHTHPLSLALSLLHTPSHSLSLSLSLNERERDPHMSGRTTCMTHDLR